MLARRRGLSERGRSLQVEIQDTGDRIILKRKQISNRYLSNIIDASELEYVADCLELCEGFEYNKTIADVLFILSNPDINGIITPITVREVQVKLTEEA